VLVFPDDRERDVRGSEPSRRLARGKGDGYAITAREEPRSASYGASHQHGFVGDQPGGLSARELELIGEEAVEPFGRLAEDRERK